MSERAEQVSLARPVQLTGGRRETTRLSVLPPLSLYVHVPWCIRKCPYCDFNSHAVRGDVPEAAYVDALIADLESALPLVWGRRAYSIFFGGGTPSLLSPEAIDRVLSAVRARVPLASDAEITLEANPGTAESGKFAGFRAAGVNRLSVGIQSFNPDHLRALGRVHDDADAHRAAGLAREHFDNFNLDLMYALPGQTTASVRHDVLSALGYEPPHLSVYHLTIEPNTLFHSRPPVVPEPDEAAAMQDIVEEVTGAGGYEHYETSAYAQAGRRARHNLNYWQFGDYLGIGAGAHSKLSFPERIMRQARYRQPAEYLARMAAGSAVQTEHVLTADDAAFEFMMNALRLHEGFSLALFEERTGVALVRARKALEQGECRGLIQRDHERVVPTPLGRQFLNDLLELFLPERD